MSDTCKHSFIAVLLRASIVASLLLIYVSRDRTWYSGKETWNDLNNITSIPPIANYYFLKGVACSGAQMIFTHHKKYHLSPSEKNLHFQSSRRLTIGSVAPTCSYYECRGCKYKCRAEQIPVESNDPRHSPYHYRCVCHR